MPNTNFQLAYQDKPPMKMKEILKHKLFKLPEIQRLFLAYRIQYYRKYKNDEWITFAGAAEGREVI